MSGALMTRRWKLIVGIIGVLALAGVGAGLAFGLSGSTASPAAASAGLSASQQVRLEKAITAPTVAAQKVCRARCHRVSIDQSAQLKRIHPGSWPPGFSID